MKILDKVRDFFYDDEDEIEEVVKKKPSKNIKEKIKIIEKNEYNEKELEKQDISERELFKAERTFNFPFDVDDVEQTKEIKEEKVQQVESYKPYNNEYKESKPLSIRNYTKYEKEETKKEEEKRFKPTPVISPIYGILDKNYKKEDLLISDRKVDTVDKKVDYETVRKRAYSNIYDKDQDDSKGIFYNLDDKKEEKDDVKIIYNDVDYEKEEDDKTKTIGERIEEYEKSLEEDTNANEDDNILSQTKEQDLFNLIDNMYNSEDDDEEDE